MRQILISKKQSFSSLGYQISSCASKVYCSGGMHLNTVISELNGMAYKLHSKIKATKRADIYRRNSHKLGNCWRRCWKTSLRSAAKYLSSYIHSSMISSVMHLPFTSQENYWGTGAIISLPTSLPHILLVDANRGWWERERELAHEGKCTCWNYIL